MISDSINHALVVGGTGMMSGVSEYLCDQCKTVTVFARNREKLKQLGRECADKPAYLYSRSVDYTKNNEFREALEDSGRKYGDFELVVSWIHSGNDATLTLVNFLGSQSSPCRIVEVLGSGGGSTRAGLDELREFDPDKIRIYTKVILGAALNDSQWRWLTNSEISNGIIQAIESKSDEFIVGTIEEQS